MMNRTELTMDQMELVNGGTEAEADAFQELAIKKGQAHSTCMASRMAAANMYKTIGMVSVNWHVRDDKPAEFKDASGNVYTYEEILPRLEALSNR